MLRPLTIPMSCTYAFIIFISQVVGAFVSGANILGLMPVTSPSHHIWNSAFLHRLGEVGHNVTILSVDLPKPNEKVSPNVHYIHLEKGYSTFQENFNFNISSLFNLGPWDKILPLYEFGYIATVGISKSDGLKILLNYPDSFKVDLIIYDYTLGPTLLGFMHKFNYPPTIGISAFLNPPNTMDSMSNHYFPAYIPHHTTDFLVEMNFWQRFENTLVYMFETAYRRLIYLPRIDSIMRTFFPKDMPTLAELAQHTTLSMVNSHPIVTYVEPVPPNVIEIAGMHILNPRPLPKDIEEFLNKSTNGVILVAFGTNIQTTDLKEGQVQAVIDAMKQLPQYDFLWKVDVKKLNEKLPRNVLPKPFLPQRDILAHPKTRVFVTHGGALSTQESIWEGVKMIGIPFISDQHRNIRQFVFMGAAVKLDVRTLSTEELRDTIKRVAEDRQMTERLKYLSAQFRDRPMKPLDTAVWWVEYLLRSPTPEHLKSPAERLYLYQAYSVDVLLVLWTILVLLGYLILRCLLFVNRTFTGKKQSARFTTKHKRN